MNCIDKRRVSIWTDFGKLEEVIIHRPGEEMNHLDPERLSELLFEDLPELPTMQKHHDYFADLLRKNGVKVHYIEGLAADLFDKKPNLKLEFIDLFLKESNLSPEVSVAAKKYFLGFKSNKALVDAMIAGATPEALGIKSNESLAIDPLPNILFQRDPFSTIGNGFMISNFTKPARKRESMFIDYVMRFHPDFADATTYYKRTFPDSIEGGDVIVFNKSTVLVGVSERTEAKAIAKLATMLINDPTTSIKHVYAIHLPTSRLFMHLDTVLAIVDYGKFIAHPILFADNIKLKIVDYAVTPNKMLSMSLREFLTFLLNTPPVIIPCGGNSRLDAAREQWNEATNVLAIAPGKIISYNRSPLTINLLRQAGVEVLEIPATELIRGRGGPHCMSMPIRRAKTHCCAEPKKA